MPRLVMFAASDENIELVQKYFEALKVTLAPLLSCEERKLRPEEIVITLMKTASREGMTADLVVDITAAAYPERVREQDAICTQCKRWLEACTGLETKVWLKLCELGHSDMP